MIGLELCKRKDDVREGIVWLRLSDGEELDNCSCMVWVEVGKCGPWSPLSGMNSSLKLTT